MTDFNWKIVSYNANREPIEQVSIGINGIASVVTTADIHGEPLFNAIFLNECMDFRTRKEAVGWCEIKLKQFLIDIEEFKKTK